MTINNDHFRVYNTDIKKPISVKTICFHGIFLQITLLIILTRCLFFARSGRYQFPGLYLKRRPPEVLPTRTKEYIAHMIDGIILHSHRRIARDHLTAGAATATPTPA
jgi:hypothetical protein